MIFKKKQKSHHFFNLMSFQTPKIFVYLQAINNFFKDFLKDF